MIKHYEDKEHGRVIAVATGCEFDAINKIMKRFQYVFDCADCGLEKALMPNTFKAVATCHPEDTYDFQIGRQIADEKLMAKLKSSEDKAIQRWKKHMINRINAVDLTDGSTPKKGK